LGPALKRGGGRGGRRRGEEPNQGARFLLNSRTGEGILNGKNAILSIRRKKTKGVRMLGSKGNGKKKRGKKGKWGLTVIHKSTKYGVELRAEPA